MAYLLINQWNIPAINLAIRWIKSNEKYPFYLIFKLYFSMCHCFNQIEVRKLEVKPNHLVIFALNIIFVNI